MNRPLRIFAVYAILVFICTNESFSQKPEPSYNLDFIKGKYIDSTKPNEILLIFRHSTKSNNEEKLIISGRLTYSLGDSIEKTDILGKGDNSHSIQVFGKDIALKGPNLYRLIQGAVDFTDETDFKFIVFYLRNLSNKYVPKMTFTYGLWEPTNQKVRIETKYEIALER